MAPEAHSFAVPARHGRLVPLPEIGVAGVERLMRARVAIVGLGAIGSVVASTMARMGVGALVLIDRDLVEDENLGSQVLFEAADARDGLPKAVAATKRLSAIDPGITLEQHAVDLVAQNVPRILAGVDLVMDGSDNFEVRFLINDLCVRDAIPWVYAGVIGHHGQVMAILPGKGPCLRCYIPDRPPPGTLGTCDTDGVLSPASQIVANLACIEGLRILMGTAPSGGGAGGAGVIAVDAWEPSISRISLARGAECVCCARRSFDVLAGGGETVGEVLCGRHAVQISGKPGMRPDFARLARSLAGQGEVRVSPHLLRLRTPDYEISLFPDARAIIKGMDDPVQARSLYSRLFGL